MRILVLADIHANWPALKVIDEPYDTCIFLGDLVDYGVMPLECIEWVTKHVNFAVRGNHDHSVAQRIRSKGDQGLRRLAALTREQHWNILSAKELKFLARFPVTNQCEIDGLRFHLVHATPWDPLDEYLWKNHERWTERTKEVDADFLCVGHSHIPFEMETPTCKVLNPGSVGQPRDGDPRCSFVIINNGKVEFHRREYDIKEILDSMEAQHFPDWSIRLQREILTTGGSLSKEQMDAIV